MRKISNILQNNNITVSFLRVFALLSVLLSHTLVTSGIYDYSVFDYAKSLFLLLSGMLYANKVIDNKRDFIKKRILKILLPMWIFSLFISIMEYVATNQGTTSLLSFFIILINFQGINSIFFKWNYFATHIIFSTSSYWFITVITICYIILVLIKNTSIDNLIKNNRMVFIFIMLFVQVIFAIFFSIQIGYIFAFFIGYVFYDIDKIDLRKTILFFVFVLLFGLLRLMLRNTMDNTVFYNEVIIPLFNASAASFIAVLCYYLQNKYKVLNVLNENRIFRFLERNS